MVPERNYQRSEIRSSLTHQSRLQNWGASFEKEDAKTLKKWFHRKCYKEDDTVQWFATTINYMMIDGDAPHQRCINYTTMTAFRDEGIPTWKRVLERRLGD